MQMILYCLHLLPQQCAGCFKFVMSTVAQEYSFIFNAKKSKCLVMTPGSCRSLLSNGSTFLLVAFQLILWIHSHTIGMLSVQS